MPQPDPPPRSPFTHGLRGGTSLRGSAAAGWLACALAACSAAGCSGSGKFVAPYEFNDTDPGPRPSPSRDAGRDRDAQTTRDDAASPVRRDSGAPDSKADARVPDDLPGVPSEQDADAPDSSTPDASITNMQDLNPPQFTHDVIDLSGSYDVVQMRLGALRCATPVSLPPEDVRTCFVPFHLGQAAERGLQALGHIALVTAAGADVHAASAGIISFVGPLDANDEFGPARVEVRPSLHSVYTLEYVNLTQVTAQQGQAIAAGEVLGQAGPYVEPALGSISFGVRKEQQVLARICPERYGDASWVARLRAAREASNQAFASSQWPSACISETIVCGQPPCLSPEAFVAQGGDVDLGRLIYASECASCHGAKGEGDSAIELITCPSCGTAQQLAERTALDMPPEGQCFGTCAADVTAFVMFALQ